MSVLWRGSWATRTRIVTGLVLFIYVLLHLINIGLGIVSPEATDGMQEIRLAITRTWVGTVILYGALLIHAALALGKIALTSRLRLTWVDVAQIGFGISIPLLLASHIVFTRGAAMQFGTNDTVGYLAGLIWTTPSAWQQVVLLSVTWIHGCVGIHMWLRMAPQWRRNLPALAALGTFFPVFAVCGFITEGRRGRAALTGSDDDMLDFMDATNFPGPGEFADLTRQSSEMFWLIAALLSSTILVYLARIAFRPKRSMQVRYVNGPTVAAAPGPTLLEISQNAGVPHMALCGGRGRCTTCRVIIEEGMQDLPAPSAAEAKALRAVEAHENARLACQLRVKSNVKVYRVFQPDGRRSRGHASQSKEAQLAILFLDIRGYTARTTGQMPYDVVFLLNRFFDAIVPPIDHAGGTVDKYLGDGLLAVFELPDARSSAKAALTAARDIGRALDNFNDELKDEGIAPLRIGLGLHLGTLVLGEIGAVGQSPRTLIGNSVNTTSRLEAETKALGVEGLFSRTLLDAAGFDLPDPEFKTLQLRGVADPLEAWPVARLSSCDLQYGEES